MRTIFILMDSLNRHMLPAYGNDWVRTPNIDRLAANGVVFDERFAKLTLEPPAKQSVASAREPQ